MEVVAIWEDKRNNSKRDLIHENSELLYLLRKYDSFNF